MTKPYTLFGSRGSGSAAVEVALHLTGAPFECVRASSWEPDSAQDALARVNPLRQIPTLVFPDGRVMTESAAILIELGLRHPASRLLPTDAAARAQQLRGLVYIAANCYSEVGIADYPERWLPGARAAARERLRQGARARLHRAWATFAEQFRARPYLGGRSPGALDILAAVVSHWSGSRAYLRAQQPHFSATLARIESHRRIAPVLRRHWPEAGS
jgi:GST-like protein